MAADQDEYEVKYHRESWMSDDQWYCAKLFADLVGGFHHVIGKFKPAGAGVRVSDYASPYASFDLDRLTRLVFMAHDRCVRVELDGSSPQRIGFMLHRRHTREGCSGERHPTLEQSVAFWRDRNPSDEAALRAEAGAVGWMPIESAPKDVGILACHPEWMEAAVVRWDEHYSEWMESEMGVIPPPTHWQPLPPRPSQKD